MRRATRRRFLAVACGGAAGLAGCGDLSTAGFDGTATGTTTPAPVPTDGSGGRSGPAAVETVVSFDDRGPNGLAVDEDGAVYVSTGIAGEIRKLPADRTSETGLSADATERVAGLDPRDGFLYAIAVHDGALYAALSSRQPGTHGVWRLPLTGHTGPSKIAAFDTALRLRDVFVDEARCRLLVTHDRRGAVSAVALDGSETGGWLDHERLDATRRGPTGLASTPDGDVLVSHYERGRILRVPVGDDGAAGTPDVAVDDAAELSGAAGLATDGRTLYVAARNLNRVVRLPPDGSVETLATADAGLDLPTDVAVVRSGNSSAMFVANFGFEPMVGLTGDPSIVRLEL